jgi:hypothetical protein
MAAIASELGDVALDLASLAAVLPELTAFLDLAFASRMGAFFCHGETSRHRIYARVQPSSKQMETSTVEVYRRWLNAFVTWNAKHVAGPPVPVLTPRPWLRVARRRRIDI